jgi:heterodisulfide reductase subunit A-like polyferredoxin
MCAIIGNSIGSTAVCAASLACAAPRRHAAQRPDRPVTCRDQSSQTAAAYASSAPAAAASDAAAPPPPSGQQHEQRPGLRAVVVGAGPAGVAAALYLANAGWRVDVFERREEDSRSDARRTYLIGLGECSLQSTESKLR